MQIRISVGDGTMTFATADGQEIAIPLRSLDTWGEGVHTYDGAALASVQVDDSITEFGPGTGTVIRDEWAKDLFVITGRTGEVSFPAYRTHWTPPPGVRGADAYDAPSLMSVSARTEVRTITEPVLAPVEGLIQKNFHRLRSGPRTRFDRLSRGPLSCDEPAGQETKEDRKPGRCDGR